MRKHNPHGIQINALVSQFAPMLLAVRRQSRRKYLNELDQHVTADKALTPEDARVRQFLHAIQAIEAEEAPPKPPTPDKRFGSLVNTGRGLRDAR